MSPASRYAVLGKVTRMTSQLDSRLRMFGRPVRSMSNGVEHHDIATVIWTANVAKTLGHHRLAPMRDAREGRELLEAC
jgi:hypothetical protein